MAFEFDKEYYTFFGFYETSENKLTTLTLDYKDGKVTRHNDPFVFPTIIGDKNILPNSWTANIGNLVINTEKYEYPTNPPLTVGNTYLLRDLGAINNSRYHQGLYLSCKHMSWDNGWYTGVITGIFDSLGEYPPYFENNVQINDDRQTYVINYNKPSSVTIPNVVLKGTMFLLLNHQKLYMPVLVQQIQSQEWYKNNYGTYEDIMKWRYETGSEFGGYYFYVDEIKNRIWTTITGDSLPEVIKFPGGGTSSPIDTNAGQYPNGTQGGTGGTYDNSSDKVDLDITPRVSLGVSGKLLDCYKINTANLRKLNKYLWSTDFLDTLSKYVNGDPMKCITGLMSVPFEIPSENLGSNYDITILNQDTGANGARINALICTIDCGTLSVPEYWGTFMDYNTKIGIYLPYIGMHDLDIQDCMNSTISLIYKVDLMTGACVANINISKGKLNSYIYQFAGSVGIEYPLSSADRSRYIAATISALTQMPSQVASQNPTALVNSATSILGNSSPNVQHTGAYNGNSGALAPQSPYLYIQRAVQSVPKDYASIKGYTSNITSTIGALTGLVKVSEIHLKCDCYQSEYDEIIELLKKGILV